MGLKDSLQRHNIPLPSDFDERMDLLVAALRKSSTYNDKLAAFKRKRGGADGEVSTTDWLGPSLNSFVDNVTTPEARLAWSGLFGVVFFAKYLESIPAFGGVVSVVLEMMLLGGKMLTKTVQKALPPLVGLLPIPYASMFGLLLAAIFGMLMWPIIGIVSLSRGDFTAAIESYIRSIPPPIGDTIADLFLEGNRTVAGLNAKRIKLVNDLSSAFNAIAEGFSSVSSEVQKGFTTISDTVKKQGIPIKVVPGAPAVPPAPTGGIRFSRRVRRTKKWRMHRTRRSMPSRFVRR
jgi:hypothetical protein